MNHLLIKTLRPILTSAIFAAPAFAQDINTLIRPPESSARSRQGAARHDRPEKRPEIILPRIMFWENYRVQIHKS